MFGRQKNVPKNKPSANREPKRHGPKDERPQREVDIQEYMRRLVNDSE